MARFRSRRLLRPAGFDELGLRRAIADRILPFLVAAMALLAALALAGWVGAASLARHWQQGAASALTIQVPQPREPAAQGSGSRIDRVVTLLVGTPGIAEARPLTEEELAELLRPWLGSGVGTAGSAIAGGDRGAPLEYLSWGSIRWPDGWMRRRPGPW